MSDFHRSCQTDKEVDTLVTGKPCSKALQPGTLALGSVEGGNNEDHRTSLSLHLQLAEANAQERGISSTGINLQSSDFSSNALFITYLRLPQSLLPKMSPDIAK